MTSPGIDPLVIAISSRALFDLADSHAVYEQEGLAAYQQYQIEHEDEPLQPGVAFHLVEKLLNLNQLVEGAPVEVILLSRNSADTGLRVFNSIEHYHLNITRAHFAAGTALIATSRLSTVICFYPRTEQMSGKHWSWVSLQRQSCLSEKQYQ